MRAAVTPFRFFRVVPLHSAYMLLALAAAGGMGAATLILDPRQGGGTVAPVLLLQMFAASSGFAVPARRGQFDLLFTGGASRVAIGLTHWALSVLPGLAVWVALGAVEVVSSAGSDFSAFASGSVVAFALVSSLAWAMSVRLPRLSGGILWLLSLAMVVAMREEWRAAVVTALSGDRSSPWLALIFLICPFVSVGWSLPRGELLRLGPALVVGLASVAVALAWIVWSDQPLEASQ